MPDETQQLQAAIAVLESQRAALGNTIVDALLAPARAKLAALAPAGAAEGEAVQTLKQVSILFLDVVGSTQLSQQLDPETVSSIMDDALRRGTAVVQAHRGRVLQYAGDSILAAFGADGAREDDAEQAVCCGLALLALGRAPGSVAGGGAGTGTSAGAAAAAPPGGREFQVRVGIHTGGVVLGGGVDAEGTIRGLAVNIAARMEQTAPPGGLRISHDTYALVRGLFDVDAQPPQTIKGVDTPVQSYLVRRAKPRKFRIGTRGIEGVATTMVGRDAELEALQGAFHRVFAQRRLAAVCVVSDAGLGKSRLLYEFEAWSETRPETFFLFKGRATPQTGSQAFGLLRDVLAWRFQIADDDSVATARSKLEHGIVPLFEPDDGPELAQGHAHLLGHLIGIEWQDSRHLRGILDDPKQIRNRAFHTAAQLFRRVGARDGTPVVLQIEDLHWADGESLDFLNYLVEVDRDVPLLVLGSTRPALFERRPDWDSSAGVLQRVELLPLDKRASRDLANELLKKLPEIPAALRELLIGSAEGNPFYMEELLRMLIDQGAVQTGDVWQVNAHRLLLTKVPPTLTGVLQARLDGLPTAEKRALQQASVVGAVFWDQALAAVDTHAAEQLPALVQRELTVPRADAALDGLREYAFRHQVLHQVTYDTVLKTARREGHARVARWLAELTAQGGLRAGDFLGIAAEHFEHAGDQASAAEFHARAAEQAGLRFAHQRVLSHVERALALLGEPVPAQAALRWRLLCAREQTLLLQARRDEQATDLDALAALAEQLSDDRKRAELAWRRGIRAMRMADWAAADAAAQESMDRAARAGDDTLRLRAVRLLAGARVYQGQVDAGRALALQGLAEARALGLRGVEAKLLNALSIAADIQGDLIGPLALHRQCLQIHRETGDRINEAICLANLGVGCLNVGDLVQARRELDAALHMLRVNGDRTIEGAALVHLSRLALWQGDETRALALARSARDIAAATRARDIQVIAALVLGEAELALGRLQAAHEACTQAHALAVEIDDLKQLDACAGLSRVALARGDVAGALAALQPVLQHAADGGTLAGTDFPRQIELSCHQALARAGDARAADWLERAHTALMAQAGAIDDAGLRQGYLHHIPHHREIIAARAAAPT